MLDNQGKAWQDKTWQLGSTLALALALALKLIDWEHSGTIYHQLCAYDGPSCL
jgi:hypothetical protein